MMKNPKEKRFDDVETVKIASQMALGDIKVDEFQSFFTQWGKILGITSNGEYFSENVLFSACPSKRLL